MQRTGSSTGLCEVCGEDDVPLTKVIFEGSTVFACRRCMASYELGRPASTPIQVRARPRLKSLQGVLEEFHLIDGYGRRIRSARVKRNLTQEDLSGQIKEKESTIRSVEKEKLRPTPGLVRKLEHALNIKLTSQAIDEADVVPTDVMRTSKVTLGDVAVFKEGRK